MSLALQRTSAYTNLHICSDSISSSYHYIIQNVGGNLLLPYLYHRLDSTSVIIIIIIIYHIYQMNMENVSVNLNTYTCKYAI